MTALLHQYFQDVAWPYISNASPTETRNHWIAGSNVINNLRGQFSRRPAFVPYTSDEITGTVDRIFTWSRWSAGFYIMLSVTDGATIKVYKLLVGTDSTFQLLSTANSTSSIPYDFEVSNNYLFFGNGTDMWKYDGTTVTKWGIAKPGSAPVATPSAGALSPTFGYRYRYAFANTTHIGAVSDESANTGAQTTKQFTITGSTTADTQVTRVYIFRTVDGGSDYLYLTDIAYSVGWSYVDNTLDTALSNVEAPALNQNEPPPASRGVTFFANRLWTHAGDAVYFSNFEEQKLGMEEQSFDTTNVYNFGREVKALAVVQKSLLVITASSFYRITGDTINTFARAPFLTRYGTNDRKNVSQNARIISWLDTSGTIWYTDATSTQELSIPIRPDTALIGKTTSSLTFHNAGILRWLVVQDSAQSKMWVFDQDLGTWNVPWSIAGTAIHSGEVSEGNVKLLVAVKGNTTSRILALDTGSTFADTKWTGSAFAVTPYACSLKSGMMNIVPARSEVPNDGMAAWGDLQYIGIERNSVIVDHVSFAVDDDATASGTIYNVITQNRQNPARRVQGSTLFEDWYYARTPSARRASFYLQWDASTNEFKAHTLDIAYEMGNSPGEF